MFKTVNCVITHIPTERYRARSFILYKPSVRVCLLLYTANKQADANGAHHYADTATRKDDDDDYPPSNFSCKTSAPVRGCARIERSPIFMCFCLTCVCTSAAFHAVALRCGGCVCVFVCTRRRTGGCAGFAIVFRHSLIPCPCARARSRKSAERSQPNQPDQTQTQAALAANGRRRRRAASRCRLIPFSACVRLLECSSFLHIRCQQAGAHVRSRLVYGCVCVCVVNFKLRNKIIELAFGVRMCYARKV